MIRRVHAHVYVYMNMYNIKNASYYVLKMSRTVANAVVVTCTLYKKM